MAISPPVVKNIMVKSLAVLYHCSTGGCEVQGNPEVMFAELRQGDADENIKKSNDKYNKRMEW